MKWRADPKRREAMTEEGYLITWADNTHGTYFNAWGPASGQRQHRKHLESGYDKEKCKAACETHFVNQVKAA